MQQTLTNRGRFALTAMIDLASMSRSGPVSLSAVGARQGISKSYLEQLFGKLRSGGLVRSTRGPGGGYALSRQAADISVADVLIAIDIGGEPRERDRRASRRIDRDGYPYAEDPWAAVNQKLIECLATVSLQALVEQRPEQPAPVGIEPAVRRGVAARPVVVPFKVRGPNSVFALGHSLSNRPPAGAPERVP